MRPATKKATAQAEQGANAGNALASADAAPMVSIVVDTREQAPWSFDGQVCAVLGWRVATVRGTLDTGDYAVLGHEAAARIERKSLQDFIASVTRERERFWRELERLAAYRTKAVIVEATITTIEREAYRSQAPCTSILASANAIMVDFGIPLVWAGTRNTAEWTAAWMLRRVYQRAQKASEGGGT